MHLQCGCGGQGRSCILAGASLGVCKMNGLQVDRLDAPNRGAHTTLLCKHAGFLHKMQALKSYTKLESGMLPEEMPLVEAGIVSVADAY